MFYGLRIHIFSTLSIKRDRPWSNRFTGQFQELTSTLELTVSLETDEAIVELGIALEATLEGSLLNEEAGARSIALVATTAAPPSKEAMIGKFFGFFKNSNK